MKIYVIAAALCSCLSCMAMDQQASAPICATHTSSILPEASAGSFDTAEVLLHHDIFKVIGNSEGQFGLFVKAKRGNWQCIYFIDAYENPQGNPTLYTIDLQKFEPQDSKSTKFVSIDQNGHRLVWQIVRQDIFYTIKRIS